MMMWYWVAWMLAIAITFVVGESIAVATNGMTLSRFVWIVSDRFPAFGFFMGFLAGFLACHFWWGGIVSFEPVARVARFLSTGRLP